MNDFSPSPQPAVATRSAGFAALHGLVLAGGHSRRMQRDKAALSYDGRSQLERAVARLAPFVDRVFVAVRADQHNDALRAQFSQIVDVEGISGPLAGIVAAQISDPQAAWLVLACDLPLLDSGTLAHLVDSRQPQRTATAYRSAHDGLPEPLCAIYEPASAEAIRAHLAGGGDCPRKFLIEADTELLDQPVRGALDNVNTPADYALAQQQLGPPMRRIAIQYYALLREQAGRSTEDLDTTAATPRELYQELAARHPFSLPPEMLRVAVNESFADWSQPLAEGDSVVFIPPVAGG